MQKAKWQTHELENHVDEWKNLTRQIGKSKLGKLQTKKNLTLKKARKQSVEASLMIKFV